MLPMNGPLSDSISESISRYIKISNCIIHFDLSHSGLNEDELLKVLSGVKSSKSLNCIHLSGNFITKKFKSQIGALLNI